MRLELPAGKTSFCQLGTFEYRLHIRYYGIIVNFVKCDNGFWVCPETPLFFRADLEYQVVTPHDVCNLL